MSESVQSIFSQVNWIVQLDRSEGFTVDPVVIQACIAEHLAIYGGELRKATRMALLGSMVAIRTMHLYPDMVNAQTQYSDYQKDSCE